MYAGRIIIVYLIVLAILVFWFFYSYRVLTKMLVVFRVMMDDLYYQVSSMLYHHRADIYKFEENIPILLQYKTQEFQQKAQANYYHNYEKLIKEIIYISELTNSPLQYDRARLDTQQQLVIKGVATLHSLSRVIGVLTLGVSTFILPKLP